MKFVWLLAVGIVLFAQFAQAVAENLVKTETISISGASSIERSSTTVKAVYGGLAGTCSNPDSSKTCDTCQTTTSTLNACNQSAIHSGLNLTVSFKTTKDVANAVGKLVVQNSGGSSETKVDIPAQSYTANSTIVTAQVTWGAICSTLGLGATCSGATTTGLTSGKILFGIDSDINNTIDSTELTSVDLNIHVVKSDDTANISNGYCTPPATTAGACRLKFTPGDEKVYIDEQNIGIGASIETGVDFDGIAIFPVPTTSLATGTTTISSFKTGTVNPIIREMNLSGSTYDIPISEVSGNLENYQTYCFIYGTRNKAQNIYHFVTASADSTLASEICQTPSEVVGALQDKHCFISTAAFGSDMAKEVQTFRKFRNEYLLTNELGKKFVKTYYQISPPIADVIAKSDSLRALTRAGLYPVLIFSSIALQYGILAAILSLLVVLIVLFKIKSVVKQKRILFVLFILVLSPALKAQVIPQTETVHNHPDAAEGLVRITKDGTYIYDLKRELKSETSRISFGHATQPDVTIDIEQRNDAGAGTGVFKKYDFSDLYEESESMILSYDYEKFPWIGKSGKLGYQLGGSIMYAEGHGVIVSKVGSADYKSREKFTFFTIPLMAGLVYRLEWKDKQLFAPYMAGGGTYTALLEKREDKSSPLGTGAPGFYATGGVLFNISQLDDETGFSLDSEYGISNLWVSLEYKAIEVQSDAFNFSNRYVNLGVSFDF